MYLDDVLKNIGTSLNIRLVDECPDSVSIVNNSDFYIKPTVEAIDVPTESKLILFSAPGATGKSALAKYISASKKALLWDLSKEKIANHSFSGMLVESLGMDLFSTFTAGLQNGTAALVIDALDEAEMISGRVAVETLLSDLRTACKKAKSPNIILCARTEMAHLIKEFYSKENTKLAIAHYEIGFFEEDNAIKFIERKIAEKRRITPVIKSLISSQFTEIKKAIGEDTSIVKSFLGYAPVLEALAVYFDSKPNTIQLLQNVGNSVEAFCKIMHYILSREQSKVVSGFKQRCQKEFPEFKQWDIVYSEDEQIIRLAEYLIFDSDDYDNYKLNMPNELGSEYSDILKTFLKDHPFIQATTKNGSVKTDFAGVAFRDYVLARLMTIPKYDALAKDIFLNAEATVRCPSSLFFEFYRTFAKGEMALSHFSYLYDSFKAREVSSSLTGIIIEEIDRDEDTQQPKVYISFSSNVGEKTAPEYKFDFVATPSNDDDNITIKQINNAYIDLSDDIAFGGGNGEDVIICNSTIKCRKIILNAPNIMLIGENNGETLLVSTEGFEVKGEKPPKFEIRVDQKENFKVSAPDANDWYKLSHYAYNIFDENEVDLTKFENAVKTILKYFRKHGKDAPGRHYEFIKNIVIGGSSLKQNIHDFFLSTKIIYRDSKDPKQYKLDMERLEKFGVNWGYISQSAIPNFKPLFEEYNQWIEQRH